MGTSSSYSGPNGKNPLLPDDYSELWKDLKSEMSQLITGNRRDSTDRILRKYINANGGSSGMSERLVSGGRSLGKFIDVLNSMNELGIVKTLEEFKVTYTDQNLIVSFTNLANIISPDGAFKEDTTARQAMLVAFSGLYEIIERENLPIDKPLSDYPESFILQSVKLFTTELIFEQLMSDLGNSFEKYGENLEIIREKQLEIHDFIASCVSLSIDKTGLKGNTNELAQKILKNCFEIFSGE